MRRTFAYAVLIIVFLTLVFFLVDSFLRPIIPQSIDNNATRLGVALVEIMAILAYFNEIVDLIRKFREILYKPQTPTPAQEKQNKELILNKVRIYWIRDVLEKSLHKAVLLELGMSEHPEMVNHPWDVVIQRENYENGKVMSEPDIFSVYQSFGGRFLILGEPGSGKTTSILELARDLLEYADQDELQAIPVVFNLSTWGITRGEIKEWLIDELFSKYHVPFIVAREWIEKNKLILLLDGLDEIKKESQEECVVKLNKFIQEHPVRIIVTSRLFEYKYLPTKLSLEGAIVQQPLSHKQIDQYLKSLGSKLSRVRKAIRSDKILLELAQTPLVLSIIAMAYQGLTLDGLKHGTKRQKMDRLFEAYIKRMFEQRKIKANYTPNQMVSRLIWLAKLMQNTAQTIFRVEQLQPSALSKASFRRTYLVSLSIILWISVSASFGLATGVSLTYLSGSVFYGSINGIFYGMTGALAVWALERSAFQFVNRLLMGIFTGLSFAMTFWIFNHNLAFAVLVFLALVVVVPFMFGRIYIPKDKKESDLLSNIIIRRLDWSWRVGVIGFIRRIPAGIVLGLAGGLAVSGFFGWSKGFVVGIGFALVTSLVGGLAYGSVALVIEKVYKPNEGTWNMFTNALRFGIGSGLIVGIILGYIIGDLKTVSDGIVSGSLFFCATFICGGLVNGGLQVLEHMILRILLNINDDVPLNYPTFLNNAVHHIFLRNVGNGYIFIHRLLLDHFASKKLNSLD